MFKNIKMIITDLDGTLLRSDKTVSDYTVKIFNICREKGIKTVFASARNAQSIKNFTAKIAADGLIATNGVKIIAGGEVMREYTIPAEISRDLLLELGGNKNVLKIGARKINGKYTNDPVRAEDVYYDFTKPLDETVTHLSFRTGDSDFADYIAKKYSRLKFFKVTGENLYDVNPNEADKLNGVKILADYYNINMSEIACFGDDYNDIEMLRSAGFGVAVANAIDEVKAVANYVCESNDNDGVAKWIEENELHAICRIKTQI